MQCIVCQKRANLHCCADHNYCSASCHQTDSSKHGNDCLGIFQQGGLIQRHTRIIVKIQIERTFKRKSSQEDSTTEEKRNRQSTSEEVITESFSETEHSLEEESDWADTDEDQAETDKEEVPDETESYT
ncbi:hypothetical protein TNCV_1971191 [Trichonephila clavipes]|uniref:MYND-type domain-containing protein n=1 Tax=Trichonephila clavipes TaxID=2585209 RepID=A0A8X6W670_TRICX|nr:hypothetical protein TNCV_1971191 [Trichonephila clavipes]